MDETLRGIVADCAKVTGEAMQCVSRGQKVSDDFLWAIAMLEDSVQTYAEGLSCYWREELGTARKAYGGRSSED